MAQPTFQPVSENVFPKLESTMVRSRIPGTVEIDLCWRSK